MDPVTGDITAKVDLFAHPGTEYEVRSNYIPATTCDLQQCGILTSVDLEDPVQPPFELRNSK